MYIRSMTSAQNPEAAIAAIIREKAKAEGITLEAIHQGIGMSQRTFTRYMASLGTPGARTFSVQELISIASVLGTTFAGLIPEDLKDAA